MNPIFIGLLTLLFVTFAPVSAEDRLKLEVFYPKNNETINASSVFVTGNTDSDAKLIINNEEAKVYPNGIFVHITPLVRGVNVINIQSTKKHAEKKIKYIVNVPEYEKTIPAYPLKIEKSSIQPDKNFLYKPGDIIKVSFKGSTGQKASFSIGAKKKNIPMKEQPPKKIYAPPVYGKETQISIKRVRGIYKGCYKIKPEDNFNKEIIKVSLVSGNDKISVVAVANISVIFPDVYPIVAEVTKDFAVTRNAPGQNRFTPLPRGTRLNIDGKIGSDFRFKYYDSVSGWIAERHVLLLPKGNFLPENTVRLINITADKNYVYLKVPLEYKLPFIAEQISPNVMNLKLGGAKLNVDLFSYNNTGDFIDELTPVQESDDCLKLIIKTNQPHFWGYEYYYEGNTLVFRFRKPPEVNVESPLKDKIICIDPGHGGDEQGAFGPAGIHEKTVNLDISLKLKRILESKGAKVIMTRTSDKYVGLYDRTDIANAYNSQVIVSIHNNSLPYGRNPYEEHGTSTYYYHSQSLPLAKTLHKNLLTSAEFKDFGIFYGNYVLTRPIEAPSVLLEIGFMINPDEYNQLITSEFQDRTAAGIALGLEEFFLNNSKK